MSEEDLMKRVEERDLAKARLRKCKGKSKKQNSDLMKVSHVKPTNSTSKPSDMIIANAKSSDMLAADASLTYLTSPPMKKQRIVPQTSEFTLEFASPDSIVLAKSLSSSLLLWSLKQEKKSRLDLDQIAQLRDAADAVESRATDEMQRVALADAKVVKLEKDIEAAALRECELKEMNSSLEKLLHEAKEAKENSEATWLHVGLKRRLDMVKAAGLDFKKCLYPYELKVLEIEEADDDDDDDSVSMTPDAELEDVDAEPKKNGED